MGDAGDASRSELPPTAPDTHAAGGPHWPDWAPRRWGWTAADDLVVPAWNALSAPAGIGGVCLSPGGYLHREGTAVRDGARRYPLVGWAPGIAVWW